MVTNGFGNMIFFARYTDGSHFRVLINIKLCLQECLKVANADCELVLGRDTIFARASGGLDEPVTDAVYGGSGRRKGLCYSFGW